jgi:hypothetical protein
MPKNPPKSKPAADKKAVPKTPAKHTGQSGGFPLLQRSILKAKGVTDAQIKAMEQKGICCREDFAQVGDAPTLIELSGMSPATAEKVMAWALGAASLGAERLVVATGDTVFCVHCKTKQPKDYKSGDLCISCGKQAEPIQACYWCYSSGPGKFCRQCAAEFVPAGELELAVLLKRDGLPKDAIPVRLREMSPAEKEALWGRVRLR